MGPPTDQNQRLRLEIQGLVQGVGFRPHVVRLAAAHGLRGSVGNTSSGVRLELEGSQAALEVFTEALLSNPPRQARIDRHSCCFAPARGAPAGIRILACSTLGAPTALLSPDLALCAPCLAELQDPGNRRFGYPFISCADCGPRYSVAEQLPFEREHTTFRTLPLCPDCSREFTDPTNRRFHAQTISCTACGPQLDWNSQPVSTATAIKRATEALAAGAIVALQGIGGFQLLVDPSDGEAVQRLRDRKGRPEKPLALLATATWMEQNCCCTPEERALWQSAAAPILLLRRKAARGIGINEAVAGNSPWLGVMRASSGLQHLLLQQTNGVVVATSANRSGEPICADAHTDADVLQQLADHVLSHNLPVHNRIDDSVMRWSAGAPLVLRLGRGLAPLALPAGASPISGSLALGAQLKGSFAVATSSHHLLSPDLGDLSSLAGAHHHQHTCHQWLQRHGLVVNRLACDQHPDYSSSQWAEELAADQRLPLQTVQHHHAHLLAVMAEHRLRGNALGVAWDGSGQGDNATLWGGEGLVISPDGYRRVAHLRPWRLPGGERAQREPRRAALGLLLEAFGSRWEEHLGAGATQAWRNAFSADELKVLEHSSRQGLNSPLCSSIGRLFDAVAALLGVAQRCSYEAQAALALEALARRTLEQTQRPNCLLKLPLLQPEPKAPLQWDWQPLLEQLLDALQQGTPPGAIALGFHQALAQAVADLAAAEGAQLLLLAGGCFQNALLLELSVDALAQQGCRALWPQRLPCNDAALPIGQLLASETLLINRVSPQAARHVPGRRR
jgi:hydrogenase maturation protein HypF